MENGPFENVFPIEHGDFPSSYVSLLKGIYLPLLLAFFLGGGARSKGKVSPPGSTNIAGWKIFIFPGKYYPNQVEKIQRAFLVDFLMLKNQPTDPNTQK